MDKLNFKTTIEDVIRLFGTEGIIYSKDHNVFIRELVQNAMDSIVVYRQSENAPDYHGEITIEYDKGSIIITDNGWGLDHAGVVEHFAHPLRGILRYQESGSQHINNVIGHFGVGFLSVFKVSGYVEIETRRKGCEAVSITLGLAKEIGKGDIHLNSFIGPTTTDMAHGMRIKIDLGLQDLETSVRADLVNSEQYVLEALEHYIKHPPADISIFLLSGREKKKILIAHRQFRGEDLEVFHKVNIDGIEGVLAYSNGLEKPIMQVCQRGLLVNENYPTLLPESVGSIVGEINFLRTDIVDLSLSRETFLENEKFDRLKSILAGEIAEFDRKFKETMDRKIAAMAFSPLKSLAVNEDSMHATSLLELHARGIQKNIYHHKICTEVMFFLETSNERLLLPDIVKRARLNNLSVIHVYEADVKYIWPFATFDGENIYAYNKNCAVAVEYLKETGQMAIKLTKRENATLSFMRIVSDYIRNSGLGANTIETDRVINSFEPFPLKTGKVTVKIVSFKDLPKRRAFYYKYGESAEGSLYLNIMNEQAKEIIDAANDTDTVERRTLIEAYCKVLFGDLESAAALLHEAIMNSPGAKPPELQPTEEIKNALADLEKPENIITAPPPTNSVPDAPPADNAQVDKPQHNIQPDAGPNRVDAEKGARADNLYSKFLYRLFPNQKKQEDGKK